MVVGEKGRIIIFAKLSILLKKLLILRLWSICIVNGNQKIIKTKTRSKSNFFLFLVAGQNVANFVANNLSQIFWVFA